MEYPLRPRRMAMAEADGSEVCVQPWFGYCSRPPDSAIMRMTRTVSTSERW